MGRKPQPDSNEQELAYVQNKMSKLTFETLRGPLGKAVEDAENEIIKEIESKMDQLMELQKEKNCFLNGKIPNTLINDHCLPKLAKIWKNTSTKCNKSMHINTFISSSDSDDTW